MKKLLIIAAIIMMTAMSAQAAQFTISDNIYSDPSNPTLSTYSGSVAFSGVIGGGYDAFDNYGYLTGLGALTLDRQIDALTSINTYRFWDIFTNNTADHISQIVRFSGNLGSDSTTVNDLTDTYRQISHELFSFGHSHDPVVALVNGNNAWAAANMNHVLTSGDYYYIDIALDLNPGESVGILNFAFLARDEDRDQYDPEPELSADIALALSASAGLVTNPYVDGIDSQELALLVNFDLGGTPPPSVPEPSTFVLAAFGLLTILGLRRNFN